MALGGGIWTTQNKVLPGTYVAFSNVQMASAALSDRGIAAIPIELPWGPSDAVFTVESGDLQKHCKKIFGYSYDADELLAVREIFQHATTVHFYRLLASNATKASNDFATAKYAGTRGNDIKIVVQVNVDDTTKYDVQTWIDNSLMDTQTVATSSALEANDFVDWKSTAVLAATAATPLTGGTAGSEITADQHQAALDAFEKVSFNALGCPSTTATIIGLYEAYTERLRDEVGKKFQLVVYQSAADYEGVISVDNAPVSGSALGDAGLVYWLTGAEAGCEVNKTLTNQTYDGELEILAPHTQTQLEQALEAGKLCFHSVDGEIRVLEDVNTLQTTTDTKGDVFKSNQTIRVIDQIANDTAVLFNTRYLGKVPNDSAGRSSLWNDICTLLQALQTLRAIENFETDSVTVTEGDTKKAVVCTIESLDIVNAMAQLYMSVVIA